jgi:hypothetical protein
LIRALISFEFGCFDSPLHAPDGNVRGVCTFAAALSC